jgi:toxin ParE1/3/4
MKPLDVYRSSAAEDDLVELWKYVAKNSPTAAEWLIRRLDDRIESLRLSPDAGERIESSRVGVGRIVEGNYLVFYQHLDDSIRVIRILHASRRWEELL